MVEALMLWNEPNNLSHWDFEGRSRLEDVCPHDHRGSMKKFRKVNPALTIALGGMSPVDPNFVEGLLGSYGVLDFIDVVTIHGFPLD